MIRQDSLRWRFNSIVHRPPSIVHRPLSFTLRLVECIVARCWPPAPLDWTPPTEHPSVSTQRRSETLWCSQASVSPRVLRRARARRLGKAGETSCCCVGANRRAGNNEWPTMALHAMKQSRCTVDTPTIAHEWHPPTSSCRPLGRRPVFPSLRRVPRSRGCSRESSTLPLACSLQHRA